MPTANQPPPVSDAQTTLSLAFPFQLGAGGFPAMADPKKTVFYHIAALLLTGKNEKVMNPGFGVNIHSYVFDNLTPITMARISSAVTSAIETWVPEAKVLKVMSQIEKNEDGTQSTIILNIVYRVANQTANMQVPIPVGL
jgi:phage baseplate assembly protein W